MIRGIDHIELIVTKGFSFAAEPHLVEATGRTIANFRDPDGWALQLVDSHRRPPER